MKRSVHGRAAGGGRARAKLARKTAGVAAKPAATPPREAPAVAVATPPRPARRLDTARSIGLSDVDWRWATWRELPPLPPPPEPCPFDIAACCQRLAERVRVLPSKEWDFSGAGLPASMTQAEARFWLAAMASTEGTTPEQRARQLAKKTLPPATIRAVARELARAEIEPPVELPRVLANLFSAMEVSQLLLEAKRTTDGHHFGGNFFHGYRQHVFPRLAPEEKAALRAMVAPRVGVDDFTIDHFEEPTGAFYLAVLLGLHRQLQEVVASWPDGWFTGEGRKDALHVPQIMIFGLGSAEAVDREVRRLRLGLHHPTYVRGWLAHTEYAGVDLVVDAICKAKRPEAAAALTEVLALVLAPEAAVAMLEVSLRSRAPELARAWLDEHVGHAALGCAGVVSKGGPMAGVAAQHLKKLTAEGLGNLVSSVTDQELTTRMALAEVELPELRNVPPALSRALADRALAKAKPPRTLDRSALPALEIGEARLGSAHVDALLAALTLSSLEKPHAYVVGVRAHATRASADAFAWALFEQWSVGGFVMKDKWALSALGLLGDDASALRLAPLVRAWPGQGFHQRAVAGVEAIAAIGTDVALVQVAGIAHKLWFPALKRRAEALLEAIAHQRDTSVDDLEDSIVSDGGFDAHGRRFFELGKRRLEVVLDRDATPMLRDESGRRTEDLPSPREGDDLALAQRAATQWRTLRASLKETFEVQVWRLEQAMVRGRTWSAAAFTKRIAGHPLMSHLARGLVWGVSKSHGFSATFRVAEDGTFADVADAPFRLPAKAAVGLVHPLDLDEPSKARWGQLLAEYEIVPAFSQLDREVYAISPAEGDDDLGTPFKDKELTTQALLDTLRQGGWTHGSAHSGDVVQHRKRFPAADVTAVVHHWTFNARGSTPDSPQMILGVHFLAGSPAPDQWSPRLPLAKVPAKCLSEVLYDLAELTSD